MGPVEDSTRPAEDREPGRRQTPGRRPRTRRCLLKGCERRFRPRRAGQRYCSAECRRAARQWSRWKAQQSYRATAAGKEKRNGQSRRYRERVRNRQQAAPEEAVPETARVITQRFFSTTVATAPAATRDSPRQPRSPAPALLFAHVPARHGTSLATGAALAPRSATAVEDLSQTQSAQISRTY